MYTKVLTIIVLIATKHTKGKELTIRLAICAKHRQNMSVVKSLELLLHEKCFCVSYFVYSSACSEYQPIFIYITIMPSSGL